MSTTVTLQPADALAVDNFLKSTATADPTGVTLIIGHDAVIRYRTIMDWDLTSLPADAVVTAATLTLEESSNQYTTTATIRLYRVTESGMTEAADWDTYNGSTAWATEGGDYSTTTVSTTTTSSGDLVLSDAGLVDLCNDAINFRSRRLRIILATQDELDDVSFGRERGRYHSSSAASSGDYPSLALTYTTDQTTPEHLVIGLLDADSDVTDLVSTRISAGFREQADDLPCIVVECESIEGDDSLSGTSQIDIAFVEVTCYGATYAAASTLAQACIRALRGKTGSTAQGETYSVAATHSGAAIVPLADGSYFVTYPLALTVYLER